MKIKVAIVEDEKDLREALRVFINFHQDFRCEHCFDNAEDAIAQLPTLFMDVVIMDIHLPMQSGIQCVQTLKKLCPSTQFLMWTSLEDNEHVFEALKAGATGYLTKTTDTAKIFEAITDIYKGGSPMSSHIARKIVASFNDNNAKPQLEKLTAREKEIVEYLSKGLRYKEIASLLFVSTETVRTHIRNIYEKLQVNSRTEAINKVYSK